MVRRKHVGLDSGVLSGVPHKGLLRGVRAEHLPAQPRLRHDDVVTEGTRVNGSRRESCGRPRPFGVSRAVLSGTAVGGCLCWNLLSQRKATAIEGEWELPAANVPEAFIFLSGAAQVETRRRGAYSR